jgi:competence ComEA-like helix-hairpin-helix protein
MRRGVRRIIGAGFAAALLAAMAVAQHSKLKPSQPSKPAVLDINRASEAEFEKLPGIGPELARRIVNYRKKHGPYRRVEDLMVIRGMGVKKWRALRRYLAVGKKSHPPGHTARHGARRWELPGGRTGTAAS